MNPGPQAVILAGGLGTRLWPVTKRLPKALVPVAGVPYIDHQLRLLRHQNITDVVLLTGFLGDQIEAHVGNGARFGLSVRYSCEATPLGTGGALRRAGSLLADDFLLIYGDSFLPISYNSVRTALVRSVAEGVIVVYDNRLANTGVPNNIAVDDEAVVLHYDKGSGERSGPALRYVDAGVLALRRALLDHIPEGVVSLEQDVFPKCIARRKLLAFRTSQQFYDIGTPERLRLIEAFFHDYYAHAIPY